jgi:hypothetical protein
MSRLSGLAAGLSALGLLFAASAASASPAVNVTIGADLAKKTPQFGARDVEQIRGWLKEATERALARKGAASIERVDLVLENAAPNRPTFEQMRRTPGLSFHSIGLGGAKITGTVTGADGVVKPVNYQWYENDLRQEHAAGTWSDAERAFYLLADRIAKDKPADRLGPGAPTDGLFGDYNRRFF